MKYMGSKNRHAKEILEIILKNRTPDQLYVEPFVGGANVIDKLTGPRLGNDNNYYLIALLKAIQDGWEPPDEVTEEEYRYARAWKEDIAPELAGFIGFCCSYSGKWWGGYARGNTSDGRPRNYTLEAKNNLLAQAPNLKGIIFTLGDYADMMIENCVVYCDPPYSGTTPYDDTAWDVNDFWDWVRETSKHNQVFTSEYNAPPDFECVWSKQVNNTLVKNTGSKQGVEKLFVWDGNR